MNNFIRDYLVKLYIPRITWTDIIEIVIIAFVIYNVMVWIKNTKAWVLLKGIIIVVIFFMMRIRKKAKAVGGKKVKAIGGVKGKKSVKSTKIVSKVSAKQVKV